MEMEHFLFALVLIDDTLKQAISTSFKHCTRYEISVWIR